MKSHFWAAFGVVAVSSCFSATNARASSCGDEYQYSADSYTIGVDPPLDCLVASVSGANQPGCDQLMLVIKNACEDAVSLAALEVCYADYADPNGYDYECDAIAPGETGEVFLNAFSDGPYSATFDARHGTDPVAVSVEMNVVDGAGCSAGSGPLKRRGMWASLLALTLLFAARAASRSRASKA